MHKVCRAATCRALDRAMIEDLGIPGRQLMEVAGRDAARAIHERWAGAPVAVLCGPGNNGGDGYVVARWLAQWGHAVAVWASGPPKTESARANAALCRGVTHVPSWEQAAAHLSAGGVLVDALLGTGQTGPLRGRIGEALAGLAGVPAARVALDVPTGLNADTGQRLGEPVVAADLTVTFGRHKPGLLAMPGANLAGEVVVVDLGFDLAEDRVGPPEACLLTAAQIADWLPRRSSADAKWNRGHVAIRANGGAGVLAARGAFAVGAGLVTLLTPRRDWGRLHGLPPEVILAEPDAWTPGRHDVLVLGPAVGRDDDAGREILHRWDTVEQPVVGDADAITHLARRGGWGPLPSNRVLTPHAAEAARLLGTTRDVVDADRLSAIQQLGENVVLKGPFTLVGAAPQPLVNPTGCARLATAGTGDILAGMVGGLWAQGLSATAAAASAVWLHGRAGERIPPNGTASDVVAAVRLEAD